MCGNDSNRPYLARKQIRTKKYFFMTKIYFEKKSDLFFKIFLMLYTNFFTPLGGFLVGWPNIEKAWVCLLSCTDFRGFLPNGICAGYKRRYHSVFWNRVRKEVRLFEQFVSPWTKSRDPICFVTFSQNEQKKYARPEALMSIPNVLTQEPSRRHAPRGAICPAGPI